MDANGIRTIVEYINNDDGKKVKVHDDLHYTMRSEIRIEPGVQHFADRDTLQVTRKIRRVEKRTLVNHKVAERKNWPKFGAEKGKKPGPDNATTTVGENVTLKLVAGNKVSTGPFAIAPAVLTGVIQCRLLSKTSKKSKPEPCN